MELFDTRLASAYIWACSEKKDRSFPPKQVFRGTQGSSFDRLAVDHNQIGDYPIGRYDELGRYHTYCPPLPSIAGGLGRYIMHPGALDAQKAAVEAAY
jgi:hypothetical protein